MLIIHYSPLQFNVLIWANYRRMTMNWFAVKLSFRCCPKMDPAVVTPWPLSGQAVMFVDLLRKIHQRTTCQKAGKSGVRTMDVFTT